MLKGFFVSFEGKAFLLLKSKGRANQEDSSIYTSVAGNEISASCRSILHGVFSRTELLIIEASHSHVDKPTLASRPVAGPPVPVSEGFVSCTVRLKIGHRLWKDAQGATTRPQGRQPFVGVVPGVLLRRGDKIRRAQSLLEHPHGKKEE